jgi:hypothetical protein
MPRGSSLLSDKPGLGDKRGSSSNQAVLQCVEKALLDTLGESAETATLYFIETNCGVKLSKVSRDPEGFVQALRAIFGAGSAELMKAILREVRSKEAELGQDKHVRGFAAVMERALESDGPGRPGKE